MRRSAIWACVLLTSTCAPSAEAQVCPSFGAGSHLEEATADQLERNLAELDDRLDAGELFGPRSLMWRVNGETAPLLMSAFRDAMELAHPGSAQGFFDHSAFFADPKRRALQTMDVVGRMIFGEWGETKVLARGLFAGHARVRGTMPATAGRYQTGDVYAATQIEPALWIHEVTWLSALIAYETFVGALTGSERDRYVADTAKFGMLLGIPEARLPKTADELAESIRATVEGDEVAWTPASQNLFRRLKRYLTTSAARFPSWVRRCFGSVVGCAAVICRRASRSSRELSRKDQRTPRRFSSTA